MLGVVGPVRAEAIVASVVVRIARTSAPKVVARVDVVANPGVPVVARGVRAANPVVVQAASPAAKKANAVVSKVARPIRPVRRRRKSASIPTIPLRQL